MNRREQFKPETQCRADGCNGELFFKIIQVADPVSDNRGRQPGNRSPLHPVLNGSGHATPNQHQPLRMFPEGSRILSSFCKKHTCTLFLTEDGCSFKKPIHDTVCALHTKCPIPNCTRAKSQYLDANNDPSGVPKYLRHEFCPDHKCINLKCPRRRALHQVPGQPPNGQQRFLTTCQQHHCKAESCLEPSQEGRNSCQKHECKTPDCRMVVEGSYPFCAIHIKCTVAACNKARYLPKGAKEHLPGCETHATCAAGRCSELRVLGPVFCLAHTCQERGCDKPVFVVAGGEAMYCKHHSCDIDTCRSPKAWGKGRARGRYCSLHTCRNEKCGESVESLALFCAKHECSKERCLAKVLDEQLCIDHFKALYIAKGRGEPAARPFVRPIQEPRRSRESFTGPRTDDEWQHSGHSRVPSNLDMNSHNQHLSPSQPRHDMNRKVTVSSHAESDYDDEDGKESIISRPNLTDEEGDQWAEMRR